LTPFSGSGSTAVRRYLVAYNVLSALGWSYVFFMASKHLSGLFHQHRAVSPPASPLTTSGLKRILGSIPYIKMVAPVTTQTPSQIPPVLLSVIDRAKSTFEAVGWQTAVVQSFAALEVVHSLLGWVRSPVSTTAMQVASRLILVWGIAERYEAVSEQFLFQHLLCTYAV
jgi:very-long-chain (3R)-3-hydroxyacyl-CoA dehydratase